VRALALGEEHSCALGATGRIACWGTDREGRVGLDATLVNEPTTLPAPSDASALAAGLHSCAADRQGDVWCWGQPGEFSGSVFLSFERMPTRVEGFERIVTLALGNDHLCGVDAEGQLHCMGRDDLAQLANTGNAAAPRRIDAW
jgi:alpha-tubulin suppressor-like RCC1 family protein